MNNQGEGAPVRESPVDEDTHKQMLSYYHRKQEEQKKLEQDKDDSYWNNEWANSNSLKSQLINQGKDIKWKY